jgi:hypothetical protein
MPLNHGITPLLSQMGANSRLTCTRRVPHLSESDVSEVLGACVPKRSTETTSTVGGGTGITSQSTASRVYLRYSALQRTASDSDGVPNLPCAR